MFYRLLFRDPVSRMPLDEQELRHCDDEGTAMRWLAAQLSELEVELWKGATMLAIRTAGESPAALLVSAVARAYPSAPLPPR